MNVDYAADAGVAVVELKHPPVNALDRATRRDLTAALNHATEDPEIEAIVLWGGPERFSAGADVAELARGVEGDAFAAPTLVQLIATVEACPKPVIAAIAGVCMGGGMELALGCHERLIAASASLALPEVRLGLLPGAGGTQRLPRLIGVANALAIIVSGESIRAERAIEVGIGQRVDGDLRSASVARARAIVGTPVTRVSTLKTSLPVGTNADTYFEAAQRELKSTLPAPRRCLEALRAAVTLPFEAGMRLEAECFKALLRTPESKALQYAFLSDRRARVVDSLPAETVSQTVQTVGVVGAGTMGAGIALCTLNAGLPTVLVDSSAEALAQALARIGRALDSAIVKGRIDAGERARRIALLATATHLSALHSADLIIEAVFEDLEVKRDVLRRLDQVAKPQAIFASNTSTLDIDRIASATGRPGRTLGLHFFSPAHVMRLLEVVRGRETSPDTLATAMAFARRLEKTAVVARVCDGFIGNRMFEEYLRQAYFLLDEGTTPARVDEVLERWGMAMGPFAVMDLAGGDIGWAVRKRRAIEQPQRPYSQIPDRICELGRFGQKTGAGFYRYAARGSRTPDPLIDDLIVGYSRDIGLTRRQIPDGEIIDRCVFALINEAARLLGEGIAQRGSDIDVVYRSGYGFPAHRGGPLFYADECGIEQVLARMRTFKHGYQPTFWEPAPLLIDCAHRAARLSDV